MFNSSMYQAEHRWETKKIVRELHFTDEIYTNPGL